MNNVISYSYASFDYSYKRIARESVLLGRRFLVSFFPGLILWKASYLGLQATERNERGEGSKGLA